MMNEDALALRTFANDVVRTENVDSTVSLYADADYFLMSQRADIDGADVIFIVGLNPSQWERVLPALDASVRKRVGRGAHLIVASESGSSIGEVATVNLTGNVTSILSRLAKALMGKGLKGSGNIRSAVHHVEVTEEIDKAATLIAGANQPVIFSSPAFFEASSNIALLKGKIVVVPPECNARGVSLMGLASGGMSSSDMIHGRTEVLYVVGEVPFFERPDTGFLIVQNAYLTPLAEQADVVLPSGSFFELSGTIIDFMGRLRKVSQLIELYNKSMSSRDIFVSLAGKLGSRMKKHTEIEVRKAIRTRMKIRGGPFRKYDRFDIPYDQFIGSINASVINGSRLVWLKDVSEHSPRV
jgi:predicted molibdopterin-dependent oxidoreductase YjgC